MEEVATSPTGVLVEPTKTPIVPSGPQPSTSTVAVGQQGAEKKERTAPSTQTSHPQTVSVEREIDSEERPGESCSVQEELARVDSDVTEGSSDVDSDVHEVAPAFIHPESNETSPAPVESPHDDTADEELHSTPSSDGYDSAADSDDSAADGDDEESDNDVVNVVGPQHESLSALELSAWASTSTELLSVGLAHDDNGVIQVEEKNMPDSDSEVLGLMSQEEDNVEEETVQATPSTDGDESADSRVEEEGTGPFYNLTLVVDRSLVPGGAGGIPSTAPPSSGPRSISLSASRTPAGTTSSTLSTARSTSPEPACIPTSSAASSSAASSSAPLQVGAGIQMETTAGEPERMIAEANVQVPLWFCFWWIRGLISTLFTVGLWFVVLHVFMVPPLPFLDGTQVISLNSCGERGNLRLVDRNNFTLAGNDFAPSAHDILPNQAHDNKPPLQIEDSDAGGVFSQDSGPEISAEASGPGIYAEAQPELSREENTRSSERYVSLTGSDYAPLVEDIRREQVHDDRIPLEEESADVMHLQEENSSVHGAFGIEERIDVGDMNNTVHRAMVALLLLIGFGQLSSHVQRRFRKRPAGRFGLPTDNGSGRSGSVGVGHNSLKVCKRRRLKYDGSSSSHSTHQVTKKSANAKGVLQAIAGSSVPRTRRSSDRVRCPSKEEAVSAKKPAQEDLLSPVVAHLSTDESDGSIGFIERKKRGKRLVKNGGKSTSKGTNPRRKPVCGDGGGAATKRLPNGVGSSEMSAENEHPTLRPREAPLNASAESRNQLNRDDMASVDPLTYLPASLGSRDTHMTPSDPPSSVPAASSIQPIDVANKVVSHKKRARSESDPAPQPPDKKRKKNE